MTKCQTGHISPLDARSAAHVVPACCGWRRRRVVRGAAGLRYFWLCVRLELPRERRLGGGGRVDEGARAGLVIIPA